MEHRAGRSTRVFEPFSAWLDRRVDSMQQAGEVIPTELRHLSQMPQSVVMEHRGMWAYGNHYRIEDTLQGNPYLTFDSGVACLATTLCQHSPRDLRPVEAELKYVGILRRIIRVDYVHLKINVMECSWIKPNIAGLRTIKQDEHGFWLIKKDAYQGGNANPYVLPVHTSQVFVPSWSYSVEDVTSLFE